nr:Chain B, DNA PROTECTION DURING STARVATION PROTEIN [synthetic construct]3O2H_B Chain B, DNA protection during starvation protein [Escherichia coli K-12]
LVKSKATNLLY